MLNAPHIALDPNPDLRASGWRCQDVTAERDLASRLLLCYAPVSMHSLLSLDRSFRCCAPESI
jgi:hypothetical protein